MSDLSEDKRGIRPAATVILWRSGPAGIDVLMGQRGAGAAFMPSKYVFPGGAVDSSDGPEARPGFLEPRCIDRLSLFIPPDSPSPEALAGAALRELREETGHWLRDPASPPLRFVFRAITPPGRSRRFDARFFLVDAQWLGRDPDDFSGAEDELSHLHWIGLAAARELDLPFITEVVLSEVTALLSGAPDQGVPFFDNTTDTPTFRRIP